MTKRKSKYIIIFWGALIFAILPIISLLLSFVLSNILDCYSAFAGNNICNIGGTGTGEIVYTMFVFGWFAFFTIPISLGLLAVSGALIFFTRKRSKINKLGEPQV